jgi:hypothetical protein
MKFKSFKIVKICLMIKIKFLERKFLYYFTPLDTFMGKGKDPDPYLRLMYLDVDPGGPKTYGSGSLFFFLNSFIAHCLTNVFSARRLNANGTGSGASKAQPSERFGLMSNGDLNQLNT